MKNKNYARLVDGKLEYAPIPLVIDGENVWTNVESVYLENDYYKVTHTDMPIKEGYFYTDYWEVVDTEIIQKWEEHKEPEPQPSIEERIASLEATQLEQDEMILGNNFNLLVLQEGIGDIV